jgi:hypothetical protein
MGLLSYWNLVIVTHENTSPNLRNQTSSLGPIFESKVESMKECFGPQVLGPRCELNLVLSASHNHQPMLFIYLLFCWNKWTATVVEKVASNMWQPMEAILIKCTNIYCHDYHMYVCMYVCMYHYVQNTRCVKWSSTFSMLNVVVFLVFVFIFFKWNGG